MGHRLLYATLCAVLLVATTARAAHAQTCITIDEPHDMLTTGERTAALLLVRKHFELAGQPVGETGCAAAYTLSHIRLGATIIVTLSGPLGTREGTAVGLDDLPAVYSQLVRSLTTGEPVGSLGVVDRTNVSAVQDLIPRRIQSESYWYARLGHGSLFSRSTEQGPVFGFGYRAEFDRVGLDFSFLNFLQENASSYYGSGTSVASLITLESLYFTNPTGNRTAYFGGGLSYGRARMQSSNTDTGFTTGSGSGLQGEMTAGYEIARATSVRLFAQADLTLPFYNVVFETVSYPQPSPSGRFVPPTVTTERAYGPSLAVSIGFGWQGRRR